MSVVAFTRNVGVAPGTTTMQLGGPVWNPYADMISLNDLPSLPLLPITHDRPVRWDIVGVIGGGSLIIALGAAFIASALRPALRRELQR